MKKKTAKKKAKAKKSSKVGKRGRPKIGTPISIALYPALANELKRAKPKELSKCQFYRELLALGLKQFNPTKRK